MYRGIGKLEWGNHRERERARWMNCTCFLFIIISLMKIWARTEILFYVMCILNTEVSSTEPDWISQRFASATSAQMNLHVFSFHTNLWLKRQCLFLWLIKCQTSTIITDEIDRSTYSIQKYFNSAKSKIDDTFLSHSNRFSTLNWAFLERD